jgi:hypothetical protein
MPRLSANCEDYPYDASHHLPGRNGYANECTVRNCPERPVVSRHWLPPDSQKGWWAAYCAHHAEEKLKRAH